MGLWEFTWGQKKVECVYLSRCVHLALSLGWWWWWWEKYGADHLVEVSLRHLEYSMSVDLQSFETYASEKESAADIVGGNLDNPGVKDAIGNIIYESAGSCEDESVRRVIVPMLDIIDRVYQRDATDLDRRIRKRFLNEKKKK